jgi:hypothetical protein
VRLFIHFIIYPFCIHRQECSGHGDISCALAFARQQCSEVWYAHVSHHVLIVISALHQLNDDYDKYLPLGQCANIYVVIVGSLDECEADHPRAKVRCLLLTNFGELEDVL